MGTSWGSASAGRRVQIVDGHDGIPAVQLEGEGHRILLTAEGVPCAVVDLPGLSPGSHDEVAHAALMPYVEMFRAERALRADLRRRFGTPERTPPDFTTSVVICTRGRRDVLKTLLESAARLDPAPAEVIVVDNDPHGEDCRSEAEGFGARYIPERRRGLNNARHTGVHAARGDLVALTDDDCMLQPGWLGSLAERFADPMVAAVTGPAFPHELGTRDQLLRELAAPYLQGLRVRTFDWTTASVVRTGDIGFGANMILRRAVLPELGELFPPELDAGTATESGGDLYVLNRVLAAGYRVCFDPAAYLLHRHGESGEPVERTVESWGRGFFAFLSRAVLRDGELAALPYASLPIRACAASLLDVMQRTEDPALLRLRWRYLRSAVGGPRAWAEARAAANRGRANRGVVEPARAPAADSAARSIGHATRNHVAEVPALTVVVPAPASGEAAHARVVELARSQTLADPWEALVVSPEWDEAGGTETAASPPNAPGPLVRRLKGSAGWARCANAGIAAARGGIVLFLDPEMDWDPGLLAAHLEAQRAAERETAVVGYSPVRPETRGLAALAERLRSEDDFRMTGEAAALTFVDIRAANLSVPRATLERVGGFDADVPSPRLGWDWGLRALAAGVGVRYESRAIAPSRRSVTTAGYLEDAWAEGRADHVLVASAPEVAARLPRRDQPRRLLTRLGQGLAASVLRARHARAASVGLLRLLEAARLRRAWLWLATMARHGAYTQGWASAGGGSPARRAEHIRVVELASPEPVPVRLDGRPLARARPPAGHWHHEALEEALNQDGGWRIAAARFARADELPADLSGTEVVFGPARRPGDTRSRRAFEQAGARVTVVGDSPASERTPVAGAKHWAAVDRSLRGAGPPIVALPMPGIRPEPRWLGIVSAGLQTGDVAAVIGAGLGDPMPAGPLHLFARDSRRLPYEYGVLPAQFIVFRRAAYADLGGFDPAAAAAGPLGPVLDFVDRALAAGAVVGYRETPGIHPGEDLGIASARARWWRASARGGLLMRRALSMGGVRGTVWFARRALLPRARDLSRALTTPERSAIGWVTGTIGFVNGCARVAVASRRAR